MAHATADIGTGNHEVSLVAGHHQLKTDDGVEAGGKDHLRASFKSLG